jgi:hypothetical protein
LAGPIVEIQDEPTQGITGKTGGVNYNLMKSDLTTQGRSIDMAAATDPREVRRIARRIDALKMVATKAGLNRGEINKIADVHIDAVRKGGEMLIEMEEQGGGQVKATRGWATVAHPLSH